MLLPMIFSAFVGADIATEGQTSEDIGKEITKTKEAVVEFFQPQPKLDCRRVIGATKETYLCQPK